MNTELYQTLAALSVPFGLCLLLFLYALVETIQSYRRTPMARSLSKRQLCRKYRQHLY
jgi:hypothetical protein